MAVNLKKGEKFNIENPDYSNSLKKVIVGLGWDKVQTGKSLFGFLKNLITFDCDASVIVCDEKNKLMDGDIRSGLVYFANRNILNGTIVHTGNKLTGAGDNDDEQVIVKLGHLPDDVKKLIFVINIYDAKKKRQHFGMIKNAYIRLVNKETNEEICRYTITQDCTNMEGLILGELCRVGEIWQFNAIGECMKNASRLDNIIEKYM